MDDDTTRLRALLDGIALPWSAQMTVVDGDEVECLALVLCPYGDDGDKTTVAEIDMGYDVECDDGHAALIVAAVNAFPTLLDKADALAALTALRPRDPHRTGHGCACCGREGAPDEEGLCPWCREGSVAEQERDEMAARRDDALADYAAVNEYLGGIVRVWQRASDEDRRMADVFVAGLRREIEEARDSGRGEWWEVCRGGNPTPLRTEMEALRAQLAAVTAERDVARAHLAPLTRDVDALRAAARAAGWDDADATGEHLVAWVRRGGACVGAEAVRDAAMSVADDLAPGGPEASDCEWAHELMHRVAAAVAKVREGGE